MLSSQSNRIRAKKQQVNMSKDVYSLYTASEIASGGRWKMFATEISGYVSGIQSQNEDTIK